MTELSFFQALEISVKVLKQWISEALEMWFDPHSAGPQREGGGTTTKQTLSTGDGITRRNTKGRRIVTIVPRPFLTSIESELSKKDLLVPLNSKNFPADADIARCTAGLADFFSNKFNSLLDDGSHPNPSPYSESISGPVTNSFDPAAKGLFFEGILDCNLGTCRSMITRIAASFTLERIRQVLNGRQRDLKPHSLPAADCQTSTSNCTWIDQGIIVVVTSNGGDFTCLRSS